MTAKRRKVLFPTEDHIYSYLRNTLGGHFIRVENVMGTGTPDVNYSFTHDGKQTEGWIELKISNISYMSAMTEVDISKKVRPEQFGWLIRRGQAGGNASLIVGTVTGQMLIIPPARIAMAMRPFVPREAGIVFCPYSDPKQLLIDCFFGLRDKRGPFKLVLSKNYLTKPPRQRKPRPAVVTPNTP